MQGGEMRVRCTGQRRFGWESGVRRFVTLDVFLNFISFLPRKKVSRFRLVAVNEKCPSGPTWDHRRLQSGTALFFFDETRTCRKIRDKEESARRPRRHRPWGSGQRTHLLGCIGYDARNGHSMGGERYYGGYGQTKLPFADPQR